MVEIHHLIYEGATGYAYPIMTHIFRGKTLAEARGYFQAHMKYDRFFRAAAQLGHTLEHGASGTFEGIAFKSVIRIVNVP